ncbi:MAG: hypothetical protein ACYTG0_13700, partial [Planctomycetota bacterium]
MNRKASRDPNPFRSPATAGGESEPDDFRAEAAEASVALMEESGRADPLEAGLSLCLPTGRPLSSLEGHRRRIVGRLVLGFVLLALAAGIGIWQEKWTLAPLGLWFAVAVLCTVGGVACIALAAARVAVPPRKLLGRRLDDLRASPNLSQVLPIGVEDASTFTTSKIVPEDLGYLGLDPVGRRIVIEGVVHRYVVRAEDVIRIGTVRATGSVGTEVVYA